RLCVMKNRIGTPSGSTPDDWSDVLLPSIVTVPSGLRARRRRGLVLEPIMKKLLVTLFSCRITRTLMSVVPVELHKDCTATCPIVDDDAKTRPDTAPWSGAAV